MAECTVEDVRERLARGEPFVLVDVREESEYAAGHIAGAISVPVDDLQRRNILVPIFLETFEGDGAIPFLPAHREKFLRRERQQRDVFEKEQIGIAAERGLLWQRGQSFL